MGWEFRIFGKSLLEYRSANEPSTLSNPLPWLQNLLGRKSKAGIAVNETAAMGISTYFACVRVISETMATLPFHAFQKKDENRVQLTNHIVAKLLRNPSNLYTRFSFIEKVVIDIINKGNSIHRIQRNESGEPIRIKSYKFSDVTIKESDGVLYYRFIDVAEDVHESDVLHFKGMGDGIVGKSFIEYQMETLGHSVAVRDFGSGYFADGDRPNGYWTAAGNITEAMMNKLDKVKAKLRKTKHGSPVVDGGIEYKHFGIKANEAQFIETRVNSASEIAGWFRVPGFKVGLDSKSGSYNSHEHQSKAFKEALLPWASRIESEFDRKLFKQREISSGKFFTKFNFKGLLKGDVQAQTDHYDKMIKNGTYSRNDVRKMEDLNPVDGGDVRTVTVNDIPLDKFESWIDAKIAKLTEPKTQK